MRTFAVVVVVLFILAGGAFLYAMSGYYNVAAVQPHWKITDWFLKHVRERSVASHAENVTIQIPVKPAMIQDASYYYYGTCKICHGAQGNPPDKFSRGMDPTPPYFANPAWKIPEDREAFWIIKNGIKMTGMAAFGEKVFKDDQILAMVDFLKKLPRNKKPG